jgi:hypothetical protein
MPRLFIPKDREIDGKRGSVKIPCRGTENGFERYTRLLYKHVEKGFVVF